jgi:hypothetical protein
MTGLGTLDAAAEVTGRATPKTDTYSSCYGDVYSISRSSDYYWLMRTQAELDYLRAKARWKLERQLARQERNENSNPTVAVAALVFGLLLLFIGVAIVTNNNPWRPTTPTGQPCASPRAPCCAGSPGEFTRTLPAAASRNCGSCVPPPRDKASLAVGMAGLVLDHLYQDRIARGIAAGVRSHGPHRVDR